jgi:hypothetical protein
MYLPLEGANVISGESLFGGRILTQTVYLLFFCYSIIFKFIVIFLYKSQKSSEFIIHNDEFIYQEIIGPIPSINSISISRGLLICL